MTSLTTYLIISPIQLRTFFQHSLSLSSSKNTWTTFGRARKTAKSNAVFLSLSFIFQFAFLESRYDTRLGKPFLAANIKGVCPDLSTASITGPSRNKGSTLFRRPSLAAICIGSWPFLSLLEIVEKISQVINYMHQYTSPNWRPMPGITKVK